MRECGDQGGARELRNKKRFQEWFLDLDGRWFLVLGLKGVDLGAKVQSLMFRVASHVVPDPQLFLLYYSKKKCINAPVEF